MNLLNATYYANFYTSESSMQIHWTGDVHARACACCDMKCVRSKDAHKQLKLVRTF